MVSLAAFLGGMGSITSGLMATASRLGLVGGGFAYRPAYALAPPIPTGG